MAPSIFANLDAQEERQVCERMASKKLTAAQCESFMQLTGIPKESPYYSPPSGRRGIFQYIIQHALQLPSRVGSLPVLPSVSMPAVAPSSSTTTPSSLSERQVVSDGKHPLSCDATMETSDAANPEIVGEGVEPTPVDQVTPNPTAAVSNYRLLVFKFLSLSLTKRRRNKTTVEEEEEHRQEAAATIPEPVVVAPLSVTPPPTEAREPRIVNFGTSTGYVTPGRRAYLFESEQDESPLKDATELLPILTPLQRAIAQARQHGYHLHSSQPLSSQSSSSSSSSPSSYRHGPPGLAHMKHKYCLRSHQVAAGDYFRKEAAHRAAVATRNYNISRGRLIPKEERHLHEPTGMIIPDYEISRLRVVFAPRKLPIRLWKTANRGLEDWIEVEDRSPTGGLGLLKCNSHLRKEIILAEPVEDIPVFTPVPEETAEEMAVLDAAIALEEQEEQEQEEERNDIKTPAVLAAEVPVELPGTSSESIQVLEQMTIEPPTEVVEKAADSQTQQQQQQSRASAREKFLQWKRIARSLSQARGPTPDVVASGEEDSCQQVQEQQQQRPPRPKPRFRNGGRNSNNIKDNHKVKSIRAPSPPPRRRKNSIGDHSVPKLTPVQRMRAAANRTITITTNTGLAGKKDKTSKRRGSSKKHNTNDDLDMPGCLDPNLAETHRKSLLEKYYNHRAPNTPITSANPASTSRASLETAITHIENSSNNNNEDALSEASDETLTNDTASVDTALDALEATRQSTVHDKTYAIEGMAVDNNSSLGKQTLQAVKNYAKNLVL